MPSSREALGVFVALAVSVGVIFIIFIYPGQPAVRCTANVQPSTDVGHWFCSETITLPRPYCVVANRMVNGSTVVTNFQGYVFSANVFSRCVNVFNIGLNVSILPPSGLPFHVTQLNPGFPWNWTAPDNQTGLSWGSAYTLELLAAD